MKNKFPKFTDISSIQSLSIIEEEIFLTQKFLFELKVLRGIKKNNNNKIQIGEMVFDTIKKPHYIIFLKRRLVHLKYQRSLILKSL